MIYVCDDNELDRRRLTQGIRNYVNSRFAEIPIREFGDGASLLLAWEEKNPEPELIFLDIYMEGFDGMETARLLRSKGGTVPIVFITSSGDHGIQAFSVYASGYLKKPYTRAELFRVLDSFQGILLKTAKMLTVSVQRAERQIPLYQIACLEADGHNTNIHTTSETIRCSADIGDFRKKLATEGAFLECGKSFIVNMEKIRRREGCTLVMQGGSKAYLPLRLKEKLIGAIEDYRHENKLPDLPE